MMRAVGFEEPGPADVLVPVEVPIPSLEPTEVLIKQKFAAVNFGDVVRRSRGLAQSGPPPYILGFEGVGTIEAIGPNVHGLKVGERVAYLSERGGYAEYVGASEAKVWRVPAGVADEDAASITCVGLTAWGLVRDSGIHPGQSALVHGASGGVGSILMQMLPLFGVEPVGLVSGDEKAAFVRSLGANEVIDRTRKDFDDHVAKFSRGIDVVFDCVGSAVLDLNLRLIRETGTWMYFGSTSGHASFPGMDVLMRRLNIRGFVVFEYFADPELWHDGTQALGNYLGKGSVKAAVSSVLELEAASLGHRMLEERKAPGKILLSL